MLNVYILKQLALLFVLTVALLSGVGVSLGTLSDLAYQMSNYGLPLEVAIKIFLNKIPEFLAYGLPIGMLLTSLIVYGRLNSDRELVAMQSCGISLRRIILPGLWFGILVGLLTFALNEGVVPQANYRVALLQQPYLPDTALTQARRDVFFPEYVTDLRGKKLQRLYYAAKARGNSLHDLTIMTWQQDRLEQITVAKKAVWDSVEEAWLLESGYSDRFNDTIDSTQSRESFQRKKLRLPETLFLITSQSRDPYAMSLAEAKTYLQLIRNSNNFKEIRLIEVRIQQKLAFPFICPMFALFGSVLGVSFANLNRGKSFGLCVGTVFIYYLLGFLIGSLGIAGVISPVVAAWLPNGIGIICGWWLWKSQHLRGTARTATG